MSESPSNAIYREHILPLVRQGYATEDIAKKLDISLAHLDEILEEATGWTDEANEIYQMLLDTWDKYIEFASPWNAKILSIFQFQSYFYGSLPAVFYVGMTGPAGSAKTAVLEILRDTCENGIMTVNASVAAIARKLGEGCTMLLDEADEMDSEKKELVNAAARAGYRPGNNYLRYDYKRSAYEEIPVYGPKGFSFIKDIEAALASRTFEIPTIKVKDDPFGKVIGNLARGVTRLEGIRTKLRDYCAKRTNLFPQGEVLSILESDDFRTEVEKAVGSGASPRDIEKTATCLLVTKIAGIDLGRTAIEAIESQATLQDELQSEIYGFVKNHLGGSEKGSYTRLKDLRDALNRSRKEGGDKPIHHKQFRAALREFGMRESMELKRLAGEGNHVLVMTEHAMKVLGLDGSRDSSQKGGGWFTDALLPSQGREGSINSVNNQEEVVKKLCELSKALSEGEKGSFTIDELISETVPLNIDSERVRKWVERASREGEIYEKEQGRFKKL